MLLNLICIVKSESEARGSAGEGLRLYLTPDGKQTLAPTPPFATAPELFPDPSRDTESWVWRYSRSKTRRWRPCWCYTAWFLSGNFSHWNVGCWNFIDYILEILLDSLFLILFTREKYEMITKEEEFEGLLVAALVGCWPDSGTYIPPQCWHLGLLTARLRLQILSTEDNSSSSVSIGQHQGWCEIQRFNFAWRPRLGSVVELVVSELTSGCNNIYWRCMFVTYYRRYG